MMRKTPSAIKIRMSRGERDDNSFMFSLPSPNCTVNYTLAIMTTVNLFYYLIVLVLRF